MSDNIIQLNENLIKYDLKDLVRCYCQVNVGNFFRTDFLMSSISKLTLVSLPKILPL